MKLAHGLLAMFCTGAAVDSSARTGLEALENIKADTDAPSNAFRLVKGANRVFDG